MGLFREDTELEKEQKSIVRAIKNSDLSFDWKDFLTSYVNDVYSGGKSNDFIENEYLVRVISLIIEHASDLESFVPEEIFYSIVKLLKSVLPDGKTNENFNSIMEVFLNSLNITEEGLITTTDFNEQFYALFDDKLDSLRIMKNITESSYSGEYKALIYKYAMEVAPFCANQSILKSEVISFINGLENVVSDVDEYFERKLTEAKKRVGVYPIDEKTLALVSAEAEKAQSLIVTLKQMEKKIAEYEDRIKSATAQGQKDIDKASSKALNDISESIESTKAEIKKGLDEHLKYLEELLSKSSETVFNRLLTNAQNKINDIKLVAQGLSGSTTEELLRIKQTTEDCIEELRDYVENEEKLQQFVNEAAQSQKVRDAIIQLGTERAKEIAPQTVFQPATPGIILPGSDRLVIPASPKVEIPGSDIPTAILPAFDEKIPFDERIKKIMDEKKRREESGEIFHEMTDEIIRCLLEGDWPYLWGPSGCGKSYTIRQVAELIGIDLIDNGKITDKYSLMAYNDPQGRFRATQAFVASVYGKLLLLDEFDNGNSDTQVLLNELYSGLLDVLEKPHKKRFITFAEDMTVPIHYNFRMISAGNTTGEGENPIYSSRGKIDESVLERMTPKHFNYDNRVEERIFGENVEWYDFFVKFRQACDDFARSEGSYSPQGISTTRDAAAIVKYIKHESKPIEQILSEKFIQTKSQDYLKRLIMFMQENYDFSDTEDVEFNGQLKDASALVLARKFCHGCQDVIEKGYR